jgi:hypothetical protein
MECYHCRGAWTKLAGTTMALVRCCGRARVAVTPTDAQVPARRATTGANASMCRPKVEM